MATEDNIKSLLTQKIPIASPSDQISTIRKKIFLNPKKYDTITYIYLLSKSKKLRGVISVQELLKADPKQTASEIMTSKIIKAKPEKNPTQIALLAVKNSLKSIPITDSDNHFLGIIPEDQIQQILYHLYHKSQKNIFQLAGLPHHPPHHHIQPSFFHSLKSRLPWILVGLFGGLFTARIINSFSHTLESNIILAAFIPLVAYIANAVGNQTQTIYIRDLTLNPKIGTPNYYLKQLLSSLFIAIACWLTILLITSIIWSDPQIGIIVGLAVFIAIIIASFFSLLIPATLSHLKFDPAIGSGPFATIIQDLLSIIIYFLIASAFI